MTEVSNSVTIISDISSLISLSQYVTFTLILVLMAKCLNVFICKNKFFTSYKLYGYDMTLFLKRSNLQYPPMSSKIKCLVENITES